MATHKSSARAAPRIFWAALCLAAAILFAAPAFADCASDNPATCTYVPVGDTTAITPAVAGQTYSPTCEQVTNNCALDIMVPYITQTEWNSFIVDHESCASLAPCNGICTATIPAGWESVTVPSGGMTITGYTLIGGGGGGGGGGFNDLGTISQGAPGGTGGSTVVLVNGSTLLNGSNPLLASGGTSGAGGNDGSAGVTGGNGTTATASSLTLPVAAGATIAVYVGAGGGGGGPYSFMGSGGGGAGWPGGSGGGGTGGNGNGFGSVGSVGTHGAYGGAGGNTTNGGAGGVGGSGIGSAGSGTEGGGGGGGGYGAGGGGGGGFGSVYQSATNVGGQCTEAVNNYGSPLGYYECPVNGNGGAGGNSVTAGNSGSPPPGEFAAYNGGYGGGVGGILASAGTGGTGGTGTAIIGGSTAFHCAVGSCAGSRGGSMASVGSGTGGNGGAVSISYKASTCFLQ